MNVEFFVKQIAMNKDKEGYIKQRLAKNYIPYEEKIARCEQIINISSYIEVDEHKTYRVNTPIRLVLTSLTLINEYTDIDVDFTDGNFIKEYNMLESQGLIDQLLIQIPEREYKTWMTLLQMINEDKQENERSLISFFNDKFAAIEKILTTSVDTLIEKVGAEE